MLFTKFTHDINNKKVNFEINCSETAGPIFARLALGDI